MQSRFDQFQFAITFLILAAFTSSNAQAWTITADFEQGVIGKEAQGISGLSDAFSQTLFSNLLPHSGSLSAKINFLQGSDAWAQSGGRIDYPAVLHEGDEIWMRGYFYFQSPWNWTCNPVSKILRAAHIANNLGGNVGYISTLANSSGQIVFSNEVDGYQPETGAYYDADKWQSIELYIKFSPILGIAITRIWKNGILVLQDKTKTTLKSSTDYADFAYLFTYWNRGVPQNQTSYMDDLVATTNLPSNHDAFGNPMIGPIEMNSPDVVKPSPPSNVKVK